MIFASTALEASAFIGLFIPGETVLLVAGFLAQQHRLSLVGAMAVAAAGAIIGDSIGYEIGRHGGESLRTSRIGRWVGEERWDRARKLLQDKGGRAIFIGRFVGFVRAVVPAAAGDARLPYPRFLFWNALGGLVWAPGVVLAGFLAGTSYKAVASWMGRGSLVIIALAVIAFAVVHVVRKKRRSKAGAD